MSNVPRYFGKYFVQHMLVFLFFSKDDLVVNCTYIIYCIYTVYTCIFIALCLSCSFFVILFLSTSVS